MKKIPAKGVLPKLSRTFQKTWKGAAFGMVAILGCLASFTRGVQSITPTIPNTSVCVFSKDISAGSIVEPNVPSYRDIPTSLVTASLLTDCQDLVTQPHTLITHVHQGDIVQRPFFTNDSPIDWRTRLSTENKRWVQYVPVDNFHAISPNLSVGSRISIAHKLKTTQTAELIVKDAAVIWLPESPESKATQVIGLELSESEAYAIINTVTEDGQLFIVTR